MTKERRDQLRKTAAKIQKEAAIAGVGPLAAIVAELLDAVDVTVTVEVRQSSTFGAGERSLFERIFGK